MTNKRLNIVGCIYMVRNLKNDKLYVGKTIQSPQKRLKKHFRDAYNKNNREYNTKFNRAIRKYGKDAWELAILEDGIEEYKLNNLEKLFIKELDTYSGGYNSTWGGEGMSGYRHTEKTKEKIRKASTGRKHSEESKRKMSEALKDRFVSEETRKKIGIKSKGRKSLRFTGHKHSEKSKELISLKHKGKKIDKKSLEKRSFTTTGVKGKGSSKYVGVSFQKSISKWRAKFQDKYIGVYKIEEEAAEAYNKTAIKKYGKKAKLNVIK